ncbi:hypothetical protein NDK47_14745 [Brevibacillus ruminantium]|uniref:Uncharacterized protein n=1 Tax=Brevibacillus ruminantium TaxID=2950604 RepID=A0ABY4W9A8_9BACL|nr:hypothetical protein [Brevibacillus ruminantium]USG63436.1 hypothetical protein NDK47_14745 [Brevibacillus ruminantium]
MHHTTIRAVSLLTKEEVQACEQVARQSLPHAELQDLCAYLGEKFKAYPEMLMAFDETGLAAFQLIHSFSQNDEDYIYLGPLFSVRKAYLPMFLQYFDMLLSQYPKQAFHLMAELQNPSLLLIFKTLFRRTSYPALQEKSIPSCTQQVASIFASHLGHIEHFQPHTLSSYSRHTLYKQGSGPQTVLCWLRSRGIYLENGASQILLLSCPPTIEQRRRIRHDLYRGLFMLKHWSRFRRYMLQKFKEGIPGA